MSRALGVVATACRAFAAAYLVLLVLDVLLPAGARTWLLGLNGLASRLVPGPVSGLFVLPTPLGGALRGDFALAAVILLAVGWLCRRVSASLR